MDNTAVFNEINSAAGRPAFYLAKDGTVYRRLSDGRIIVETNENRIKYASDGTYSNYNLTPEQEQQLKTIFNPTPVQPTNADATVNSSSGTYTLQNGEWYKGTEKVTDASTLDYLNNTATAQGQATSGTSGGSSGGAPTVPNASLPANLLDELTASEEFKSLPEDQQDLVKQVYQVIAENDIDNAQRLAAAFETATKISDPFFKQQIRIAKDAIERGFVSIDQEDEFREQQLTNQLKDLREDVATKKEFLGLEEQAALRGLEREFESTLKNTRQDLAARGMSSSSRRAETEQILNETTGDLRESTKRRFGAQVSDLATSLDRGERDIQSEVQRLTELTKEKKLDLFRQAEETLGTKNLPSLNTTASPLGDIVGELPSAQTRDIIQGATSLIF